MTLFSAASCSPNHPVIFSQYYSLEVSYFKSAMDKRLLDSLWNHYWVNTLSSSSLLTNAEYTTGQINDLAAKLESWDGGSAGGRGGQ